MYDEGKHEKLIAAWQSEVHDRAGEVDVTSFYDWESLCYGWALGKGLEIAEADAFVYRARKLELL